MAEKRSVSCMLIEAYQGLRCGEPDFGLRRRFGDSDFGRWKLFCRLFDDNTEPATRAPARVRLAVWLIFLKLRSNKGAGARGAKTAHRQPKECRAHDIVGEALRLVILLIFTACFAGNSQAFSIS